MKKKVKIQFFGGGPGGGGGVGLVGGGRSGYVNEELIFL